MSTTAVPKPTYGDNGVILPTEAAILAGVTADLNQDFNGNLNPQLTTPQGQLASTETAVIGDAYAMFAWMVQGFDPAYNSGRNQDAVGRIYFMSRIAGAPSVQPCICSGLTNVKIPIGQLGQDPDTGLLWVATEAGTIPIGGSVTLNFACQNDGPIAGPVSLNVYQFLAGLDDITPSGDAALGINVETRAQFEERRALSTAANSVGTTSAVLGKVLAVPNVLDAFVYDNFTNSTLVVGGVSIAKNSLYVCVLGGNSNDVAFAIWSKKPPGCNYFAGDTTVTITDPNPHYSPPAPQYPVTYETPTNVPFYVLVTITNSVNVPANARQLIQQAVINAFAGVDNGPRAKIGSLVYASRLYGPVFGVSAGVAINPNTGTANYTPGWSSNIVSLQLGTAISASMTGVIASGVLTASSVSGTIKVGDLLTDSGGVIATGTTIVQQLSGPTGGNGTYQLGVSAASINQSVVSENMATVTLANDIQMQIDQAPTIVAANIHLALVG